MIFCGTEHLAGINKAMTLTASDREAYSVISLAQTHLRYAEYPSCIGLPAGHKILDSLLESEYKGYVFYNKVTQESVFAGGDRLFPQRGKKRE